MTDLRTPPHAVEFEQSVLGALLLDNRAMDRIVDLLGERDFYRADHRLIWKHIARLVDRGEPADVLTVFGSLEADKNAEEAGGLAYLNALAQNTPSSANIVGYAKVVRERAVMRGLMSIADEAFAQAQDRGQDVESLLADVAQRIEDLQDSGAMIGEAPMIGEVLPRVRADLEARLETGRPVFGHSTGLLDLDNLTLGLHPGELVVIAGRPSMGKTSLGMQVVETAALAGAKVAVFSLEMTKDSLANRMVCNMGKVDSHAVREGRMTQQEIERWQEAYSKLSDLRVVIDDQPALRIGQIRARCRRMRRKHGLDMILVDHIGLMIGEGENRTQQVGSISRGLKAIAKEFDVPVIALCQLNRGVEGRSDKRPMLSDLRESGDIEQDADVVMLLYRDEYYNPGADNAGIAEVNVAKQREGGVGTVTLFFLKEFTRFENFARVANWGDVTPRQTRRGFV